MPVPKVCNIDNIPMIIKYIRDKRNLSQKKFAAKINVSFKTISAYETARTLPSLNKFLLILEVGGYSLKPIENIYKTPKELVFSSVKEEKINQEK